MEEDPDADEIIDIPTENMPGSSSSTESPNVVNVRWEFMLIWVYIFNTALLKS